MIFSVQAMSFPDESCQSTGLDDIIKFTLPNVGPASAKLGAGIPNRRGICLQYSMDEKPTAAHAHALFAQAHPKKTRCSLKEFLEGGKSAWKSSFPNSRDSRQPTGQQIQMEVGRCIEDGERIVCGR
ncbi:MAG: hypothetical protein IPL05_07500 [Betaproteobacteria bacterium]|nr:hypothetical protein [Betaproteobacteria bacterium]